MVRRLKTPYLVLVSAAGLVLAVWATNQIEIEILPVLTSFLLLGSVSQIASTISQRAGLTFSVGQAVSLAAADVYGVEAGILVAAVSAISIWIYHTAMEQRGWKGSLEQLFFNTGMDAVAVAAAGVVLGLLKASLGQESVAGVVFPWLGAAIVYDQLNLWMVAIIIYLQKQISPLKIWQQHLWAIPIHVAITAIGGYLLSEAVSDLGLRGILLFSLPLLLSAYSFRMYVRQTEKQMETVVQRTEELSDTNDKLRQLAEEKDRFLAVLSHDMRTPLTSIELYAKMLESRPDLPPERRQHMARVIMLSGRTVRELVDNLLEIERLNSGGDDQIAREPFDLAPVVKQTVMSIEVQAMMKDIQLQVNSADTPLVINGDQRAVERIMLNLLSNAIKYTPNGGTVAVSASRNGKNAVINVSDNGFGIPAAELPHIFEPFRRVDSHRERAKGTGLGLSIVKHYVEAHEGSIEVHSKEGEGSSFDIYLPLPKTEFVAV